MNLEAYTLSLTCKDVSYHFSDVIKQVKIGRSQNCHFIVPVEDVSREHCLFEIVDSDLYITDLGSMNGVYINGVRIMPNERLPIPPEAEIKITDSFILSFASNLTSTTTHKPIFINNPPLNLEVPALDSPLEIQVNEAPTRKISPRTRQKTKKTIPKKREQEKSEWSKMFIGFVIIVAFLIYQFISK